MTPKKYKLAVERDATTERRKPMSQEARLERLGLLHLINKPEELAAALEKQAKEMDRPKVPVLKRGKTNNPPNSETAKS
jgi:hypothetical protein